jgi:hypothetical protein
MPSFVKNQLRSLSRFLRAQCHYICHASYMYTVSSISCTHSHLYLHLHLLERVFDLIILPDHNLPLLLRAHMFDPHLSRQLARKLANKPGIPQFTRNAQVFAAPHQRIGFTPFRRRRNAVGVEVLLLATGYGHKAVFALVSQLAR